MQIIEVGTGPEMQLIIEEGNTKTKFALKKNEQWSNRKGTNPDKNIFIHDFKMVRIKF